MSALKNLQAILGAAAGAFLGGLLLVAQAAAQTLPPPPTATNPHSATAPDPATQAKPKPKPKPKVAKPKPASNAPLSLTAPPPSGNQLPPPPTMQSAPPVAPVVSQPIPLRPGQPPLTPKQIQIVERASAYLSNIRSLVGAFKQIGPDGKRTAGDFYLLKPGRVRFDYNPPNPTVLVADGKSIVVRDRDLASQDVYPLSETPLRFLLADRIDLLRDSNLVTVHSDDVVVSIVIEEKQILRGTYKLMLSFGARDYQLKQWVVTDPQGLDTTVVVYNLDTNTRPDPDMFKIDYTRYIR